MKNVFLAGTPRIRSNFHLYIVQEIKDSISKLNFIASIASLFQKQNLASSIEFLKKNSLPIAKGVKAKTLGSSSYIEYKLDEVEWIQIELTLSNGRKIKVTYPKGTSVPPRELFE